MKHYALLSVSDKTNIKALGLVLVQLGYYIIATPGTGAALGTHGIPFIPGSEASGNPDALKDCILSISFQISAGILFDRENPSHVSQVKKHTINPIDIVVCNFPPPHVVIKQPSDFNIQHVDVGGPLMVRAAATNFKQVLVVVDPNDYSKVATRLKKNLNTDNFKKIMALKAFTYCRFYDLQITKVLKSF